MTKVPGGWNKSKVWEDLKNDQIWVAGAREKFESEKESWRLEQQAKEKKLEQQRVQFEAERVAWKQDQQRLQEIFDCEMRAFDAEKEAFQKQRKSAEEIIQAKAELEEILKSMAGRSKTTASKLSQLKTQAERCQTSEGLPLERLPPRQMPMSATLPLTPQSLVRQSIIRPVFQTKRRTRASPTALTY